MREPLSVFFCRLLARRPGRKFPQRPGAGAVRPGLRHGHRAGKACPSTWLGPSLKIYFSYLAVSLGCMCYGPLVGMAVGGVIDSVGFLLAGYGEPYFPGYLITAILSGLIYGVMLYRRKPTVPRLLVTRLIINYGSNVLLGSVWKAMLYGKGYLYYVSTGLVKNTVLLPLEVFLTWMVLRAALSYGLDRKYIHNAARR